MYAAHCMNTIYCCLFVCVTMAFNAGFGKMDSCSIPLSWRDDGARRQKTDDTSSPNVSVRDRV